MHASIYGSEFQRDSPPSYGINPKAEQNRAPSLREKRVVIVEDEGLTLLQLRRILAQAGMQVVGSANNGQEGVEVALRERPDLILMDIRMPGEINGLDAAARILSEYPACIVMVTAYAQEDFRERAQAIGACGYVIKPIDRNTLLPQLEAAYRKSRAQETEGQH